MLTAFSSTAMFIARNPKSQAVQFTLTRRNMHFDQFHDAVRGMHRAFDLLAKLGLRFALGTYRHLEVTHGQGGTLHPHFHCLMIVPWFYFSPQARIYIPAKELSGMWQTALGVDYEPITDLGRVNNLESWFDYLDRELPMPPVDDVEVARFGGRLADFVCALMSRQEEISYDRSGRRSSVGSQVARHGG